MKPYPIPPMIVRRKRKKRTKKEAR